MGAARKFKFEVIPEISGLQSAQLVMAKYRRQAARRRERLAIAKAKAKAKRQHEKLYGRLTWKEEMFCRAYIANEGKVYKSALDAGYKNACEGSYLLNLPKVQNRIAQLMQEAFGDPTMNIKKVMKNLEKFANREIQDDPGNDRNTIAANVELAKMMGAYTEKVRLENANSGGISLSDLDLPLETKKMLLAAIREAKAKKEMEAAQAPDEDEDEYEDKDEDDFEEDAREAG